MQIIRAIKQNPYKTGLISVICLCVILALHLESNYRALISPTTTDRHGSVIALYPNSRGNYSRAITEIPPEFKNLLIKKEDRFFYVHPGINPVSIFRALGKYAKEGRVGASSTISQQLVKILLANENNRTASNKLIETLYTFILELFYSKNQILKMYANSVYLGNQAQGLEEASQLYFEKHVDELNESEILRLLATISSPSTSDPWSKKNTAEAKKLSERLGIAFDVMPVQKRGTPYRRVHPSAFELHTLGCKEDCKTTIDEVLSDKVRDILLRNIERALEKGATNSAAVIMSVPDMEILTLVGSPDPFAQDHGAQINMAIEPRPVGSTFKPFIYLKGFEKGLRPYTLVEDREYRYEIATGFPLYPKNYDGEYHGTVTLHQALSNSLNVPAVKVLEYVGLPYFYEFLENDLGFKPIRPLESYQLGIALGGLEMDLTTLTHLFTIFPNRGVFKPITLFSGTNKHAALPPQANINKEHSVAEEKYIALVNAILSDRKTGVDQFGAKGNLNLTQENYGVKTGTSRDYHDSWVVGYTPDYVVGVWMGNSENTPLKELSGSAGAGRAWYEIMELLATTAYNKHTPLDTSKTSLLLVDGKSEIGFSEDNIEEARTLMKERALIISPHAQDEILYSPQTIIPLEASRRVHWYVDGKLIGEDTKVNFIPDRTGVINIEARAEDGTREIIRIFLSEQ